MSDSILQVENLSVRFQDKLHGSIDAVRNISFQVPRGKTLAIVGESGSGKSVSSLAIMGLLPPTAIITADKMMLGDVDLLKISREDQRRLRGKRVAMIFQEPMTSLNPLVPVGDQIMESLFLHSRLNRKEARDKAIDLVDQVGLSDPERIIRRYPHELSGGQQQRIMIAMAISCEPELLIADEPTTALDVTIQKQVIELIMSLQDRYKMSLLFITHDLALVADVADEVAVMYRGDMLEKGPSRELFLQPKTAYTRGLLACRPPLDKRPRRLLTVADFMKDASPAPITEELDAVPNPKAEIILELKNLSKVYPQRQGILGGKTLVKAVDQVELNVRKGMRLGIVGESGCGKTTLARSLIRLVEPTSGKIVFGGQDISHMSETDLFPIRRRLQYIFQNPYASLNPRMTIAEILVEPMLIHGIGQPHERLEKATHLLETVGLNPKMLGRYPHEFSGGQRQRICIARVLMLEPELIICDECVSALDVSVQAQILNLLLDIQDRSGITFIFISHDLSVVKYFAEEVCVMNQGQIVERGLSDEVYARPKHAFTQRLLQAIPRGIPKGTLKPLNSFY